MISSRLCPRPAAGESRTTAEGESAAGPSPSSRALGEAEAAPKGGGERGQGWRGRRWGHARAGEGTEGGERRPSRRGAGAPWHGEARPSTYHLARQAKLDSRLPGGGGENGSGGRSGRVVLECVCLVLLRRSPVPTIPSPGSPGTRDPSPPRAARAAPLRGGPGFRGPGPGTPIFQVDRGRQTVWRGDVACTSLLCGEPSRASE